MSYENGTNRRSLAVISGKGRGSLVSSTLQSNSGIFKDREIVDHIERLKRCRTELENINETVKKSMALPTKRTERFIKGTLSRVLPRRLQRLLPKGVALSILEEYDALELIERLQRENIVNTQESLRAIAACAGEKVKELANLEDILEEAVRDSWSAQDLQAFMAERAGIEIYDEINELLSNEFHGISDEDREKRKEELLAQVRNNVAMGESLVDTMGKVCGAGLQVFHRAVSQYVDYVHVYKPIAVIRDAAKAMIETNHSNFAAKEAIASTFNMSLEAIKLAIDTAQMVDRYSITAPDMRALLESGKNQLIERLQKLDKSREVKPAQPTIARP